MASTSKKPTFMTSKGVSVYPWLNRPDTQFDAEGVYKCQLKMSPDAAKEVVEKVRTAANDEFGKEASNIKMPFKTDAETGEIVFTAKSKYQPKFVDAEGQVIPEAKAPNIFGGSTLKLSGNISTYDVGANKGVSLQLGHVQIIDLVEGSGSNPFGKEEGGFVMSKDSEASNDNYNF